MKQREAERIFRPVRSFVVVVSLSLSHHQQRPPPLSILPLCVPRRVYSANVCAPLTHRQSLWKAAEARVDWWEGGWMLELLRQPPQTIKTLFSPCYLLRSRCLPWRIIQGISLQVYLCRLNFSCARTWSKWAFFKNSVTGYCNKFFDPIPMMALQTITAAKHPGAMIVLYHGIDTEYNSNSVHKISSLPSNVII